MRRNITSNNWFMRTKVTRFRFALTLAYLRYDDIFEISLTSVKYKIRNRFHARLVISARSDPASALFDISQKREAKSIPARVHRAFIRARGYLSRFYLPRGADRQKRQIASCRFAEYAFRFSIANVIKRINEPGTNISANIPEIDDTSLEH